MSSLGVVARYKSLGVRATVPLGCKKVCKHVPSEIIVFFIVKLSAEDIHVIFEFILGADFELQPYNGQIQVKI